ncbi:hypothetical protein PMG11_04599 [Penicillium brasilianum]|uniref:Uncharacterized protein n=1 Tax=Penicillium brasilianum TaxID=104259 RepID=A0A0F7VGF5_PENBI|nr:hypothetical protein PMG11_04599 [Penicillium brasilianum]
MHSQSSVGQITRNGSDMRSQTAYPVLSVVSPLLLSYNNVVLLHREHHKSPSIKQLRLLQSKMQSSTTTRQAPGQSSQSRKRRQLQPVVDPSKVEPLTHFSDLLAHARSDDPDLRADAIKQLAVLSPLMQQLGYSRNDYAVHHTAKGFKTLNEACEVFGIKYQRQQAWNRPDISQIPQTTLSPAIDTVIERLQSSEDHKIDNSEASVRVIVELLILDRLEHLSDDGSLHRLQLYPEVDVKLLFGNNLVTGRADWLLCHEDPQDSIESTLIAIEAKRACEFSSADRQLAVYLAAIQKRRAEANLLPAIAFGIATDSTSF